MKLIMTFLVIFVAVSGISCQNKARLETALKEYSENSDNLTKALVLSTQEILVMLYNPSEASSHISNIKLVRERMRRAAAFLEGDIPEKMQADAASLKRITDIYFTLLDDTEAGFTAICLGNGNTATYYFKRAAISVDGLTSLFKLKLDDLEKHSK